MRPGPRLPERNRAWAGGRIVDKDGYVLIHRPEHPNANSGGYVREHRLVMEDHLGRLLFREEVVHHHDGDKQNNRIENLELFSKNGDHLRETLTGSKKKMTPQGREKLRSIGQQLVEWNRANRWESESGGPESP